VYGTPRRRFSTPGTKGGETPSPCRIEQSPSHCTNLIEKVDCGVGSVLVDGSRLGKQPEMGVNLFGRSVCNSPVVQSISAEPPVAFWGLR
jgi:hypothetical protein